MTTTIAAALGRLRTVLIAAAALVAAPSAALAQQFEKVNTLPRQELPAGRFVSIAYGIIWLAVLIYVAIVASGLKRVNREIEALRRKVERQGPPR